MPHSQSGWRKSSYSGAQHNCVEVTAAPGSAIAIRDSKNPGPILLIARARFAEFLEDLRNLRD